MIQTSAQIANSVLGIASAKVTGGSASAGAKGADAQKSGFSALLDDTDAAQSGTDTANNTAAATEAAAQAQRALQAGNNGKQTGKTLPPETETSANPETSGETEDAEPSEVSSTPEGANTPVIPALFALPVSPLTQVTDNQTTAASSASNASGSASAVTTMAARLDASLYANGLSTKAAALSTAAASNAAAPSAVAAAAANATLSGEVTSLRLAPVDVATADDTPTTATLQSTADRLINAGFASPTQTTTLAAKDPAAQTTAQEQVQLVAGEAIKGKDSPSASAVENASKTAAASTASEALAAAEPVLQDNFSIPVTPATPATSETTLASSFQSTAPVEGPQDFATLVSRLNEAREASGGQVVRAALSHHEFGKVSLQFSHENGGLSVTMASADPTFAGAAQVAAASLASKTGDQPHDSGSQQQQQQQQHSNNQHSGFAPQQTGQQSLGTGAGRQDQQGRSEQGGNTTRGASASASGSESDASTSQEQGGTRTVGGVYA